jgi:hypothetical protein
LQQVDSFLPGLAFPDSPSAARAVLTPNHQEP